MLWENGKKSDLPHQTTGTLAKRTFCLWWLRAMWSCLHCLWETRQQAGDTHTYIPKQHGRKASENAKTMLSDLSCTVYEFVFKRIVVLTTGSCQNHWGRKHVVDSVFLPVRHVHWPQLCICFVEYTCSYPIAKTHFDSPTFGWYGELLILPMQVTGMVVTGWAHWNTAHSLTWGFLLFFLSHFRVRSSNTAK
jgi:hypothetical protein